MTGALAASCAGSGAFGGSFPVPGGLTFSPARPTGVIPGAGAVTTSAVTVTATFGTGPYTYAWVRSSGDTNFTASSPSAATTTFTDSFVDMGDIVVAGFTCTVTDSLSATRTVTVPAEGRSSSTV